MRLRQTFLPIPCNRLQSAINNTDCSEKQVLQSRLLLCEILQRLLRSLAYRTFRRASSVPRVGKNPECKALCHAATGVSLHHVFRHRSAIECKCFIKVDNLTYPQVSNYTRFVRRLWLGVVLVYGKRTLMNLGTRAQI